LSVSDIKAVNAAVPEIKMAVHQKIKFGRALNMNLVLYLFIVRYKIKQSHYRSEQALSVPEE
jgi:hypothetical protein